MWLIVQNAGQQDTAPKSVAVAAVMGTSEMQGQALLAVETVNEFMVIPSALPPEQDVNPPVTVMRTGFRDLVDTQAQRTVIGRHRAVPCHLNNTSRSIWFSLYA